MQSYKVRKPLPQIEFERRMSDSDLIEHKKVTLIPRPDELSYCAHCLSPLLYLFCARCDKWFVISYFTDK